MRRISQHITLQFLGIEQLTTTAARRIFRRRIFLKRKKGRMPDSYSDLFSSDDNPHTDRSTFWSTIGFFKKSVLRFLSLRCSADFKRSLFYS